MILSIFLVTPITLIATASNILTKMGKDNWLTNPTLSTYLSTYITLLVNVILIPAFIDIMVIFEDFHTKSERQRSILKRVFFFMLLNSLLLPLTGATAINVFLQQLEIE